jgi:hypothetical protein
LWLADNGREASAGTGRINLAHRFDSDAFGVEPPHRFSRIGVGFQ